LYSAAAGPFSSFLRGVDTGAFSNIAVAWDGSREAVRAVHDAIPLMRRAASVTILIVPGRSAGGDLLDPRDLEVHLARHGIQARTHAIPTGPLAEHEALRAELAPGKYDLIVLGGYSHSLWREFIFGGATESILLNSATPMFVSH
jgi:nucleotide-binding universal stress UspA family protein